MLRHINDALTKAPESSRTSEFGVDTPLCCEPFLLENISTRRGFLKTLGVTGGLAVALQFLPSGGASAFELYPTGAAGMPNGTINNPHVFVSIHPDGTVTLVAHRSEMGTGSRTSIPMIIADELEADWDRVQIVQAEGDEPKYGNQDTDGSRSLRHHIQPARQIGAAVRVMLERAAATYWGVSPTHVRARAHAVWLLNGDGADASETGERLSFGELAQTAMALPIPVHSEILFKSADEFRYIGRGEVPITDLHDITTGKAIFGADVIVDGMKFAAVARPPVVGGKLVGVDSTEALKVPGVERIVEIPSSMPPAKFAPLGGIAVVASNTWAAFQGRDKLKIEWDHGPHAGFNTEAYEKEMRKTAKLPGKVLRKQGDPEAAFSSADRTIEAEYYQPHMVHAQMEPLVAVAKPDGDSMEIWAPVQSPYGARTDVADALGMKVDDVRSRHRGQRNWRSGQTSVVSRRRHTAWIQCYNLS